MSDAAITIGARGRTLSFAASAILITLLCAVMILVSRVVRLEEALTLQGVHVTIEDAPRPPPVDRRPPPPSSVRIAAPEATPTETLLPVDREMVARALSCFDRLNRDRRADCPDEPLEEEYGDVERTRRAYDPSPPRISASIRPAMGVDPPCVRGFSTASSGDAVRVQYCGGWGITPPPPSRSAEEVCLAGHVGPCRPPAFREEDVVRLAHTD